MNPAFLKFVDPVPGREQSHQHTAYSDNMMIQDWERYKTVSLQVFGHIKQTFREYEFVDIERLISLYYDCQCKLVSVGEIYDPRRTMTSWSFNFNKIT